MVMRKALAAFFGSTVAAAYVYRPLPSGKRLDGPPRDSLKDWVSSTNLSDETYDSPFLVWLGRAWLTPLIVTMSRVFLRYGNVFDLSKDAHYEDFLDAVVGREPNQGLITVSNHRSLMDDPPLISNILPYHIGIQPKYLRYGACAEEFCYNEKLPGLIYAFMGAGRSLPMWRGGGIDQKMLLDLARHVAAGEWVHIFPEAGIWQHVDGHLGGRGSDLFQPPPADAAAGKGRLKWGVGKLIAHSPVTPKVVPFFHMGMDLVMPQNAETRKTYTLVPKVLQRVTVAFGEAVDVTDLIAEHERRHGPLHRYSASASADSLHDILKRVQNSSSSSSATDSTSTNSVGEAQFLKWWRSDQEQQVLYHKITMRIEAALDALAKDHADKVVTQQRKQQD